MTSIKKELLDWASNICAHENIQLILSKPRKRKLGDFRIDNLNKKPRISINSNLSNELFVLTFLHELAHKIVYDQHGRRVKPHGLEWKNQFSQVLKTAVQDDILLPFRDFLIQHSKRPRARVENSPSNPNLPKLRDLSPGQDFRIEGSKMTFKLKKKIRTRYLCTHVESGKLYTISGNASVMELIPQLKF